MCSVLRAFQLPTLMHELVMYKPYSYKSVESVWQTQKVIQVLSPVALAFSSPLLVHFFTGSLHYLVSPLVNPRLSQAPSFLRQRAGSEIVGQSDLGAADPHV